MKESEKVIEKALVRHVESLDGICRKYVSPGVRGVPDRICIFHTGLVLWVELKSTGDKPTPMQLREKQRLLERGHRYEIIDSFGRLTAVMDEIRHILKES